MISLPVTAATILLVALMFVIAVKTDKGDNSSDGGDCFFLLVALLFVIAVKMDNSDGGDCFLFWWRCF